MALPSDDDSDFLDSGDDGDDTPATLSMAEWEARHRRLLRARFKKDLKAYSVAVRNINWKAYAMKHGVTDVPANAAEVDPFTHLMLTCYRYGAACSRSTRTSCV